MADALVLNVVLFLPLAAIALLIAVPAQREDLMRWLSLAAMLAQLALTAWLYVRFDAAATDLQFETRLPWIADWGVHYQIGLIMTKQPFSRRGTTNVPHAYHQNFVKHRGLPGMNVARRVRHVANATDGWQQLVDQTVPASDWRGSDIHHIV